MIKKISLLFFAAFSIFTIAAVASETDSAGYWMNSNSDTKGITRLSITPDGDSTRIHVYARCGARQCDWGDAAANINADTISSQYTFDFKVVTLTLKHENNSMKVNVLTDFNDEQRADFESEYTMIRE
jgi:hypothetical protein